MISGQTGQIVARRGRGIAPIRSDDHRRSCGPRFPAFWPARAETRVAGRSRATSEANTTSAPPCCPRKARLRATSPGYPCEKKSGFAPAMVIEPGTWSRDKRSEPEGRAAVLCRPAAVRDSNCSRARDSAGRRARGCSHRRLRCRLLLCCHGRSSAVAVETASRPYRRSCVRNRDGRGRCRACDRAYGGQMIDCRLWSRFGLVGREG